MISANSTLYDDGLHPCGAMQVCQYVYFRRVLLYNVKLGLDGLGLFGGVTDDTKLGRFGRAEHCLDAIQDLWEGSGARL